MRYNIIDQSYHGETVNPLRAQLQAAMEKFATFGPDQAREFFRQSGVTGPDTKIARTWANFHESEQQIFIQAAGLSSCPKEWGRYSEREQHRLWQAVTRAASWGERVKAAIT